MRQWEKILRVIQSIAIAEHAGYLGISEDHISERSMLRLVSVHAVLEVLERERFVLVDDPTRSVHREGPNSPEYTVRLFWLGDKAHRVNDVVALLVDPRMGASRMTTRILAGLRVARDDARDGWVSGRAIAAIARAYPRQMYRAPVLRMHRALDRLGNAGLLELRHTTDPNPGRWQSDYRLRLPWAPARPIDGQPM